MPPRYEATIRRTTDGVPHISGDSLADVAYGQGWVSGEDHACTLIDQVLKVAGTRAAALGPGAEGEHVASDFAWRAIGIADIAAADFEGSASAEVVEMFEAFTAGWNDQLTDAGPDGLSGWCAGADWVRPLQPVEVYTYARSLTLLASGAQLVDYIADAQPPAPALGVRSTTSTATSRPTVLGLTDRGLTDAQLGTAAQLTAMRTVDLRAATAGIGSNGWAIGRDRVAGGTGGLLLANPHFPWEGELRFAEAHLTVPGEVDVYGAQLLGVPGIGIGFTAGLAWTHTVSAGNRMTGYLLTLDPASPTSYLVDGVAQPMTATDTTVEILRPDGSLDAETRTMYHSEYGPILDFPGIGWTDTSVLTYRDANIDNGEFVEQYARMPFARSIDDLQALTAEYQGVPLFNTIAADADGNVWYADTSATPNLSTEAEQLWVGRLFSDPITQIAYEQGFVLLDGSDSRFRWQEATGARDPGLVPYAEMPMVDRTDYAFNANDSFWIPSDEFTLRGDYSILHGQQGTAPSMRTRRNAAVLSATNRAGLAGDDALWTSDELLHAAFENGSMTAALSLQTVVDACRATPLVTVTELLAGDGTVSLPAEIVDLTAACDVLAAWDGVYDLDRTGPILWRETMTRLEPAAFTAPGALFADGFDPALPTTTPSVPTPDATALLHALARAVQTVGAAGFPVGTSLGAAQFSERSDARIPIHGGTAVDGVTNIVTWSNGSSSSEPAPARGAASVAGTSLRGEGYRVDFGTSFVLAVDLTGEVPHASALLVSGQTGDRTSALFDVQTEAFSEKRWRTVAWTDAEIAADPELDEYVVQGR